MKVPQDYLYRLQSYEDTNKRILRMMQYIIRVGKTKEVILEELGLSH